MVSQNSKICDQDLLRQFVSGSDTALSELFSRYNTKIFLYCTKLLKNSSQAEDISQEIWLRVIDLRKRWHEINNPAAFFFTIARNLCLNHIQRSNRVTSIDDLAEHKQPRTETGESDEIILAALDSLNFDEREIIVLNIYCGYDFSEIAAMNEISVNAAWTRASRARKKLREIALKLIQEENTGDRTFSEGGKHA